MWVYGLSFLTEYEKGEPIQDRACWKQEFAEWLGTWTLKSDTTGSESKPCHLTACILLELFICPVTQFLFCLNETCFQNGNGLNFSALFPLMVR